MTLDKAIVRKRLSELILSKSQNDKKIIHLDEQAKILRKKLHIDTD